MSPLNKFSVLLFGVLLLLTRTSAAATTIPTDSDDDDDSKSSDEKDDGEEKADDWRDNTLIYYIWVRAFQDSDGDGEGDLQGIISRLDYLDDLGVDTIRLSPIFSSPQIDSGYDIDNFTQIDSLYGDLNDFYELIHEAHKKDLKVILDIVPNHSSNQHEWFSLSANETEPYDDYYIWADGKVEDNKVVPPNNWKSAYSDKEGSAWTWHTKRRQWYYHKFHSSESDLNFRNEDVIQEFFDILDFWLERSVDGFCFIGASYLFEDESFDDESSGEDDCSNEDDEEDSNDCTTGQSENAALMYRIREHIDEWVNDNNDEPKLLFAEIDDEDDDHVLAYYGNETHPGVLPINLIFLTKLNETTDAGDIKDLIEDYMEHLPKGAEPNWMLTDEDHSRVATRLNHNIIDGINMLTLLLPGQSTIYFGEEIGMVDTDIAWEETIDLRGLERTEETYEDYSRDPMRTPMQWDNTISGGFSANDSTFLPVNSNYKTINVRDQLHNADSDLEAFKKLSILRENPIFVKGDYEIDAVNDDNILILKRSLDNNTCLAIMNFGSSKEVVNLTSYYPNLEEDLQVMIDSSNADVEEENDEDDDNDIENDSFTLNAYASAVLCDKDDFKELEPTTTEDDENNETTTEDLSLVLPVPTTDLPDSSANTKYTLQYIAVINLATLLLLRIL